jgi:[acyl-carrier-protein] S-malonyltransferase
MKKAFVFPGQGSQFVGMGKDIAEAFPIASQVFEEVDNALNQNLSKIIFEGPIEELTLTANTQPALMAVSLALIKLLKHEVKIDVEKYCTFVAGHSLGEYSALAAADAISITDTARLLRIRGSAMQEAVPFGKGGMAAVLGCSFEEVQALAKQAAEGQVCQIANDNSDGQIVISGNVEAIDRAVAIAAAQGKKAIKLVVSAPFHSGLMKPAEEIMHEALAETKILKPAVPLIANVIASQTSEPSEIRELLEKQVTGMVRWRESVQYMKKQGITNIIEIGAGKVLANLTKRIDKEIEAISLQTPQDIEEFAKQLA